MAKQLIYKTKPSEYKWIVKFSYRKSMKDLIIENKCLAKDRKMNSRWIILHCAEIKALKQFLKRIKE